MEDLGKNKPWLWPNSWGKIRILFPYHSLFYQASVWHDIWYTRGWNNQDKQRVDELFYKMMKWVSKNHLQNWFASLYYFLVKQYWYKYFNYKNK